MTYWYFSTGFDSNTTAGTSGNWSPSSSATDTSSGYQYPIFTYYQYSINMPWQPSPPETEEQKQARLERQSQYDREQERIRKEQEQAKQKADELLKSHIGIEAFGALYKVGYIEKDSQKYLGRKYRVPSYARDLIEVLEDGKVIDRLCVHPNQRYQDSDEILTRLTLLEYAEEYLLKTANHNRVAV